MYESPISALELSVWNCRDFEKAERKAGNLAQAEVYSNRAIEHEKAIALLRTAAKLHAAVIVDPEHHEDQITVWVGAPPASGRWRKRPVTIDAYQFTDYAVGPALVGWCDGRWEPTADGGFAIIIPTLEGEMRASLGDWIIRGVKGEFYPCKPDVFERTYEPVYTGEAAAIVDLQTGTPALIRSIPEVEPLNIEKHGDGVTDQVN